MTEEESRKLDFIKEALYVRLDNINIKIIIDDKAKTLAQMDSGFRYMLNNEKVEEMGETYQLIIKSGKKETLKWFTDILEDYIKEEGDKLFNNLDLRKDPISKYNWITIRVCP